MRALRGLIVAGLVVAGPLSAQEVLLRLRPPQGQVTPYLMTMEMWMKGGPMAGMITDTISPFMRMTAWMTSRVTAAAQEEFTMSQSMDSVSVETPAMPQMAGMMGNMGDMMKGTTTVLRSTSRGQVKSMDVELSQAMKDMMRAAGQSPGGGMPGNQNPLQQFLLFPEAPVRVGSSWRDSMTVAMDSAGMAGAKMTYAATFTLRRMDGQVAVIGIDGKITVGGGQMPSASTMNLAGDTRLDLASSKMLSTAVDMSGTVSAGGMGEMPMKMKMSIVAK
jgi:hypothetical protein